MDPKILELIDERFKRLNERMDNQCMIIESLHKTVRLLGEQVIALTEEADVKE